jgi:hypothetical protein
MGHDSHSLAWDVFQLCVPTPTGLAPRVPYSCGLMNSAVASKVPVSLAVLLVLDARRQYAYFLAASVAASKSARTDS